MTARLRRFVLVLMAASGFALLGSSVQGVSGIDHELRSGVHAVPVEDDRDCPFKKTVRDRKV